MKKKLILIMSLFLIFTTGCLKKDSLENIKIYTTSYPIEYITEYLYGEHSVIESIYPDGVDIENYELNKKQIKDYSKADMYVFNGLSKDKNYVLQMVSNNKRLMIIDASQTMEYNNGLEELWLDPSNLLMMALNIKKGLCEYVTNHYLKNDIESRYDELKVVLSNIDAKLRLLSENADNLSIIVDNDTLLFLEKYGFDVISLDENSANDKTLNDAILELNKNSTKYIYTFDKKNINQNVKFVLEKTDAELAQLNKISNLTEEQRNNKQDYIYLINENIDLLKNTLYK